MEMDHYLGIEEPIDDLDRLAIQCLHETGEWPNPILQEKFGCNHMADELYKSDIFVERRRFPRKPLNLTLQFQILHDHEVASESISENISADGLALTTEMVLKKGQELMLTLFIPPKELRSENNVFTIIPDDLCHKINIRARIIWRLPFVGKKYVYGINFIEINPQDRPEFEEFLKEFYLLKPKVISSSDNSGSEPK